MNFSRLITILIVINLGIIFVIYTTKIPYPSMFLQKHRVSGRFEDAPQVTYYLSDAWFEYQSMFKHSTEPHRGIINEEDYCRRVSEYQRSHKPKLDARGLPTKDSRIVYSDYSKASFLRAILSNSSTLVLKNHDMNMIHDEFLAPLPLDVNLFIHKGTKFHRYHKIDTHFLCEGQRYSYIPGHHHISNKDDIMRHVYAYEKYYEDRPECFNASTFTPETYNLEDEAQCLQIFSILMEDKSEQVNWILKTARGVHNGDGVTVFTPKELAKFLKEYKYGGDCGETNMNMIIQRYIRDPLVVNNRKFDIRVYMLVASMDPLIILYHDGFIKFSIAEYDKESTNNTVHITNTGLFRKAYKKEEEKHLLEEANWPLWRVEDYLIEHGVVEKGWVDNFARPLMKEKMLHLFRMVSEKLLRHPRVFELFGFDFMFDSQFNLWFFEANVSPAIQPTTKERAKIVKKLVEGMIDLEYALNYGADFDEVLQTTDFEFLFDGRKEGSERHYVLPLHCQ